MEVVRLTLDQMLGMFIFVMLGLLLIVLAIGLVYPLPVPLCAILRKVLSFLTKEVFINTRLPLAIMVIRATFWS